MILLSLCCSCTFTLNAPLPPIRIFCAIKTFGANLLTRAWTVHKTWAQRCDGHVFLAARNESRTTNSSLPVLTIDDVADNYRDLSVKVFHGLNQIIKQPQPYKFDWLFVADDDTFAIMEHLRSILFHTSEAVALGHLFVPKKSNATHFSGGAGYVINTAALRRMLPDIRNTCAEWYLPGYEDVHVTRCLQHLNVTLNGAIDEDRRHHRFYPIDPVNLFVMNIPAWYHDYSTLPVLPGFDCCSIESISFHYIPVDMMNLIEWARYLYDEGEKLSFVD